VRPQIIGMIHLKALPGSPGFEGFLSHVIEDAVKSAVILESGGVDAIMMENFFDVPFARARVDSTTVAAMTACAVAVRRSIKIPLGINVLRNDGLSALSVALAAGATFIRVNILSGARITDQGITESSAYDLMRERVRLGATHIKVLADVDVKHSVPFSAMDIGQETEDLIKRSLADGIIVSGSGTGKPVDNTKLARVLEVSGRSPVILGSGVTIDALKNLPKDVSGIIVGTALKSDVNGLLGIDPMKVNNFTKAVIDLWGRPAKNWLS
jgi:membrane complex biogenesis BtpA family protein